MVVVEPSAPFSVMEIPVRVLGSTPEMYVKKQTTTRITATAGS